MKGLYYARGAVAAVVGILAVSAFVGTVYPVKIFDVQPIALLQRLLVDFSLFTAVLFATVIVLSLFLGRIYCSTLCPLGLYQELLMLVVRRKMVWRRNRAYKYFVAAAAFGTLLGGTAGLVRLIDPYSLFGNAAGIGWYGLAAVAAITVLVWFKGRCFCSNICPVGTVLGLLSRLSLFKIYIDKKRCVSCGLCAAECPSGSIDFKSKTVDNETCIKCFKCLESCRLNTIHYGREPEEEVPFSLPRRKLLIAGASAAAVFILAVKGGAAFGKKIAAGAKKSILPAGAGSTEDFANRCLNCDLCVQHCPMKIIKKADGDYGTVHIDYTDSFCDYDCHKCSEVCPSGAIERLTLTEKQKTQIGLAVIDENICIKCGLCVMKCPRLAITKSDGEFPRVDADSCIGCGACQNACPVKAIVVAAADRQRIL